MPVQYLLPTEETFPPNLGAIAHWGWRQVLEDLRLEGRRLELRGLEWIPCGVHPEPSMWDETGPFAYFNLIEHPPTTIASVRTFIKPEEVLTRLTWPRVYMLLHWQDDLMAPKPYVKKAIRTESPMDVIKEYNRSKRLSDIHDNYVAVLYGKVWTPCIHYKQAMGICDICFKKQGSLDYYGAMEWLDKQGLTPEEQHEVLNKKC